MDLVEEEPLGGADGAAPLLPATLDEELQTTPVTGFLGPLGFKPLLQYVPVSIIFTCVLDAPYFYKTVFGRRKSSGTREGHPARLRPRTTSVEYLPGLSRDFDCFDFILEWDGIVG